MKLILAVWLGTLTLGGAAGLEELLDPAGKVWECHVATFEKTGAGFGFQWVSATKDSARAAGKNLTFLGAPVYEALARFESGQLRELTVSLYNRGDAGDLEEGEFLKLMAGVDEKLTTWAGAKGIALRTQERTAIAAVRKKAWVKEPHRVDLVWSYSEKSRHQGVAVPRPEYARLQVCRFDPTQDPRKSALVGTSGQPKPISPVELRQRVKREANGDVVIPAVPMVDQGQKGYCAAAVTERMLRYYGRQLDQHEIAQLAHTTADRGTNPEEMLKALRRIADETKMEVTVLQDFDFREYEKTMTDYNRAAKRANKPEVAYKVRSGNMILIQSPMAAYQQMDPELLRESRLKRDGGLQDFKLAIQKYVNNGAPLAWSCVVGKVKETPALPQLSGGHIRIVIGFNDRTQEILYTDTWGPGHESKRMSLADAWAITFGLYSIQPREVRF
jgi:hypothetical protein